MPIQPRSSERLGSLLVVAAVLWHLLAVLSPPTQKVPPNTAGRDYATYHYAARAARDGRDPYDKAVLGAMAQDDGTRRTVHPFLYPPVFLLVAAPPSFLSLEAGFAVWFLLNELALLLAAWALVQWLTPIAGSVMGWVAALFALTYGVAYGAELGQANALVLALVVFGAWQVAQRPRLAGALVGTACMLKMSPALVVLWWASERRWSAVVGAAATAAGLAVVSLLVAGLDVQQRFYLDVLPGLLAGDYNGLVIKLGMFGNHSLPNLAHQLFPSGSDHALSTAARLLSSGLILAGLAVVGRRFSVSPAVGAWAHAARLGVVLVGMLLVPAYTYEHHLVLALPCMVVVAAAVHHGVLRRGWAIPVGAAVAVIMYPLPYLRSLSAWLGDGAAGWLVQELPFLALVVLGAGLWELCGSTEPRS